MNGWVFWKITATRENDQLFVQVTGYNRYRVFPYTDHDFFATFRCSRFSQSFQRSDDPRRSTPS